MDTVSNFIYCTYFIYYTYPSRNRIFRYKTRRKKTFFEMSFSIDERTSCVLWYTESGGIVITQRIYVQRLRRKITWKMKFISKQDWAPWLVKNCQTAAESKASKQVDRQGFKGDTKIKWPPRSPDLTPCGFYL